MGRSTNASTVAAYSSSVRRQGARVAAREGLEVRQRLARPVQERAPHRGQGLKRGVGVSETRGQHEPLDARRIPGRDPCRKGCAERVTDHREGPDARRERGGDQTIGELVGVEPTDGTRRRVGAGVGLRDDRRPAREAVEEGKVQLWRAAAPWARSSQGPAPRTIARSRSTRRCDVVIVDPFVGVIYIGRGRRGCGRVVVTLGWVRGARRAPVGAPLHGCWSRAARSRRRRGGRCCRRVALAESPK
jgi:hypothetical protein